MLFSQRYKELIFDNNGKLVNDFCQEIKYAVKEKIASVMSDFTEPQILKPNRYDNYEITTDALEMAISSFKEVFGYSVVFHNDAYSSYSIAELAMIITYNLFDLIELQYEELSANEKVEFQKEINNVFVENETPWLLIDGKIIKVDSKQFEADMQAKLLLRMKEIKDCEPKFQSALNELLSAHESFDKQDYSKAITEAEKCYESILKIICGQKTGDAKCLTQEYVNNHIGTIPTTMKKSGFKDNILMSLPYIRNNSSTDHGAGEETVIITKEFARLALNLCATLCTYLIEVYKQTT